jgi:chromate transporter
VNAWARRFFVEKKGWLTEQEYAETLGIGQVLPGANSLNTAIGIGTRFHGATGALACGIGLFAAPMTLLAADRLALRRLWAAAAGARHPDRHRRGRRRHGDGHGLQDGDAPEADAAALPHRPIPRWSWPCCACPCPMILLGLAPLGLYFAWRELRR